MEKHALLSSCLAFWKWTCRKKVMWQYYQRTLHNTLFISKAFDTLLWISCHKFTKRTYYKLKSLNTLWSPMLFFSCHKSVWFFFLIMQHLSTVSYLSGISLLSVLNTGCFGHGLLFQGEQLWDVRVFTSKLGRVW